MSPEGVCAGPGYREGAGVAPVRGLDRRASVIVGSPDEPVCAVWPGPRKRGRARSADLAFSPRGRNPSANAPGTALTSFTTSLLRPVFASPLAGSCERAFATFAALTTPLRLVLPGLSNYDGTIMPSRTQITLDRETQKRAKSRAAQLGVSFAEYVRRLVAKDLAEPVPAADVSLVFDLGRSPDSDIARDKDRLVGEAMAARRAANPRAR